MEFIKWNTQTKTDLFRSKIRLEITEYLRKLINLIDVETEEMVLYQDEYEHRASTLEIAKNYKILIDNLNKKRDNKIKLIREIEIHNLSLLDEISYEDQDENNDDIDKMALSKLNKFGIYLDNKVLMNFLNAEKKDGLLVIFNYHLSNEHIDKLR